MEACGAASILAFVKDRCYLVYALAPEGVPAREANDRLNEYLGDRSRGIPVSHDHFIGAHGGFAVFHVRGEDELSRLQDPGPLAGWQLDVHPLTFSLTPVGFVAQAEFTLESYGDVTLERLRTEEKPDPRYWWQET
jgi:hypothetical protein